jgi:proteasome lid subunit RPN8/RPN11
MDRLPLTRSVYAEIVRTVGSMKAEQGGALGWRENERLIRFFRFDDSARRTGATYSPDDKALNSMFREDWNPRGIRLAGFVHSHPPGCARPSSGDLFYAQQILAAIPDLPYLALPIVQTVPDTGEFRLIPFLVLRDSDSVKAQRIELDLVEGQEVHAELEYRSRDAAEQVPASAGRRVRKSRARDTGEEAPQASGWGSVLPSATFDRVVKAYDLTRMTQVRVVAVGVGGAAGFIEDLARCGVGEFVLIDPDAVAESNIATQQAYRKDIGRPKVIALADRLRDINPQARIQQVPSSLDDLDDAAMGGLCLEPIGGPSPAVTLLCGLTDNFYAQARINALALHLGLPSLCAQVYREGRGAEITFTYPGLTPACHRCILAPRYKAFLADGFKNDVTSHGTPIFATTRLNAIKGFLALALLHHREDPPPQSASDRFTGLAARIGSRNLLQIRMDPDLSDALGVKTFDRVFEGSDHASLLFDETVWRPQDPESGSDGTKPCPDCGGTGDLRDSIGTFTDTRDIRPEEG